MQAILSVQGGKYLPFIWLFLGLIKLVWYTRISVCVLYTYDKSLQSTCAVCVMLS